MNTHATRAGHHRPRGHHAGRPIPLGRAERDPALQHARLIQQGRALLRQRAGTHTGRQDLRQQVP